jgi:hypothetical protein
VNPSIGGTFVGYTSNPIDNTENRSLVYNGSTTYQEFGPLQPSKYSVSLWFKATGVPSHDTYGGALIAFNPQYNSAVTFMMNYKWENNTLIIFHNSPSNVISSSIVPANKITNAVCTYDGSFLRLYIDGLFNASVSQTVDPIYPGSGSSSLQLGRWGFSGYERYFNGNIYQASIYNRALSASEILQNYNAIRKKYYPEENIVTNGLIFNIDANKNLSYPGTGNTIYDLSGSGQTGTFTNGPTFSGLNGGYISFDGSNDYIDYPRSSLYDFGSSDFTIMYWINTTTKDTYNAVIDLNDAGGKMIIGTYNNLSWMWFTSSYNIVGTINLCDGIWHQATISRIGSTLTHYVDGRVSVSTNVGATVVPFNNFFSIGRLIQTGDYGQIKLADVKLYKNKGLTQQEILQNYNATKNRFVNALPPIRNGLVLELDAGQRASYPGTGNTWYDLSGNSLNGTLTNGPTFSGIGATSSIVFDRSNDYVLVGDSSLLNTFSGMTLEVIVRYTTTNSQIFAQKWNYTLGNDGYTLEILNSAIVAACYSAGNSYLSVSISGYPINNTYHMIFTLSGSTQTLYINGVSVATNSGGSVPNISGTNFTIGNRSNLTGTYFGGNVYLTKFYNRGLSAYEVKQNFDFYRTRYNI